MIEFRVEGFPELPSIWDTDFIGDDADHLNMIIIGL
jgi:hypothetical protein